MPEETTENTDKIELTPRQLQGRLEQAKRQVRKEYGLSLDEVQALKGRLGELETDRQQMRKTAADRLHELRSMKKQIHSLQSEQKTGKIRSALTRLFLDANGLPSALEDALAALSDVENLSFDEEGQLFAGSGEEEIAGEELVGNFLKERAHFVRAPGGVGSGMPSGLNYANRDFTSSSLESREGRLAVGRQLAGSNR